MSGGSRPRDNGRGTAPRHIRSVADHFLGAGPPGLSPASAPEPASPALRRAAAGGGAEPGRGYSFAVAAASDGRLAARVAAGLARCTLPGEGGGRAAAPGPSLSVWLEDRHSGSWAAGHAWLVGESPLPAAPPLEQGGAVRAAAALAVRWLNLGCADEAALSCWEQAAPGAKDGGGGDGLVWCLRAAEAGRLAAAYRLGRLLQALAPVQLKLLVFPGPRLADGPSLGEAAVVGGPSAGELDAAVRLARERAVPIVPAGCVWEALAAPETRGEREGAVPPGPSEAGPIVAARRAYAALVASLEQGAAARRRVPSPGKRAYAAVE